MSLIRVVGKSIFSLSDFLGPRPRGPRVLIYHKVGIQNGDQMEVTLPNFRRQMEWLHTERQVVGLDWALQHWEQPGSDQLVVLTFDDGYRDLYTSAFPVLEEYGMPFLLYLSPGLLTDQAARTTSPRHESLSWPEIERMLESGLLTVGAHTYRHPDLRMLDRSEIEADLEKCDKAISERLGETPVHFAYPYGFWAETAHNVVRARYSTAVLGGSPRPKARPDRYKMHRYPVQLSDQFMFFRARVKRGLRLEEQIRRGIKDYTGP